MSLFFDARWKALLCYLLPGNFCWIALLQTLGTDCGRYRGNWARQPWSPSFQLHPTGWFSTQWADGKYKYVHTNPRTDNQLHFREVNLCMYVYQCVYYLNCMCHPIEIAFWENWLQQSLVEQVDPTWQDIRRWPKDIQKCMYNTVYRTNCFRDLYLCYSTSCLWGIVLCSPLGKRHRGSCQR